MMDQSQPASDGERFIWRPSPDSPLPTLDSERLFASDLADTADIRLTIAIPTYRRPELMAETVASILAQTDLDGVELLIVDDDPATNGEAALLAAFPRLRDIPFRYYRNTVNAGLFGNWNRTLALARGTWFTLINDDDLLAPGFVAAIRQAQAAEPSADAIACSLRFLDQRDGSGDASAPLPASERVRNIFRFGLSSRRQLKPKQMFFGSIVGSGLGLVVRTEVIRALGGYRAADYPSADYFFMTRLARFHRFIQLRNALAISRVADNVSNRPETQLGFLKRQARLQEALLDSGVAPRWWRRLRPVSLGIALRHTNNYWHQQFAPEDVAREIAAPISMRHLRPVRWYRLAIGAV